MPAITITPELALAAGKDAANARARKAGRKGEAIDVLSGSEE